LPAVPRLLPLLLAALTLLAAGCGGSSKSPASAEKTAAPAATATPASAAGLPTGCQPAQAPAPKTVQVKKPTAKLSAKKKYVAVVTTSCGAFEITLDAKRAPITGGNFKYLADQHFFDGTTFHRIVKDFVIQGGDPSGDGTGGPGYTVVEAPPKSLKYTKGIVAMAKTGADPSGASGSQFFVVSGAGGGQLPPEYALLGKVTAGMDAVDRINSVEADPTSGQPASPVLIHSIVVSER
jgi:peptidyl-prolyl cis-trans isomerase B (cyclophilin B)